MSGNLLIEFVLYFSFYRIWKPVIELNIQNLKENIIKGEQVKKKRNQIITGSGLFK